MSTPDTLLPWVRGRITNIEQKGVHYESALAGPHLALLLSYFPIEGSFMIKSQARLRTPILPDPDASQCSSHSPDSQDSSGQSVQTRKDDIFPDFVVCRATAALNADQPVLIWEMKRRDSGAKGEEQIERYAGWADTWSRWRTALELKEEEPLPAIGSVLVEHDLIRVFQHTERDALMTIGTYESLLDPELDVWLKGVARGAQKV